MQSEFAIWAAQYPVAVAEGNETFTDSAVARFVTQDLPASLRLALPDAHDHYIIQGSAGRGQWTYTPWVAVLNPAVTTTVQEGYYVVYLLSRDGQSLYLSLNQGCTRLFDALGIQDAREELKRRAELMRTRIAHRSGRFEKSHISLGSDSWRGLLYEAGDVANVRYDTNSLPPEGALEQDLHEAIHLYRVLAISGGWEPDDQIAKDAEDEAGIVNDLAQAKRYKQHRAIERQASHSKAVKRLQGNRCKGCLRRLDEMYGDIATGLIEAHHLMPLSSLAEGETVTFDPETDFAVLCPNCHSVIHRMADVSDIDALRACLSNGSRG